MSDSSSSALSSELQLVHCDRCHVYTFPADAPGCRQCGASGASLRRVPCPATPTLKNFVTVHSALVPGLQVPCVVGEVELAAGVIEEALIDTDDENRLTPGLQLVARYRQQGGAEPRWVFTPVGETGQ